MLGHLCRLRCITTGPVTIDLVKDAAQLRTSHVTWRPIWLSDPSAGIHSIIRRRCCGFIVFSHVFILHFELNGGWVLQLRTSALLERLIRLLISRLLLGLLHMLVLGLKGQVGQLTLRR